MNLMVWSGTLTKSDKYKDPWDVTLVDEFGEYMTLFFDTVELKEKAKKYQKGNKKVTVFCERVFTYDVPDSPHLFLCVKSIIRGVDFKRIVEIIEAKIRFDKALSEIGESNEW